MEDLKVGSTAGRVDLEGSTHRWKRVGWCGAALVLASGGSVALSVGGASVAGSAPPTPADALASAATNTTNKGTAHMTYAGSVTKDGTRYKVAGDGDVELAGEVASIETSATSASTGTVGSSFMRSATTIYEGGAAVAPALTPGPSWIALPVSSLPFLSPATSASFALPTAALTILSLDKGITVTSTGTKGSGSNEETHYVVTLDTPGLETALLGAPIPAAAEQQALSLAHAGDLSLRADVNSAGTISEIKIMGTVTADGTPFVLHLHEKLSKDGVPVQVTYPSGGDVCTADAWSLTTCAPGATP